MVNPGIYACTDFDAPGCNGNLLVTTEGDLRYVDPQLFMFDLDYFRAYNNKYGHVAGDLCLQRVGALLAEVFKRPSDVVARCGGEEFVCVAPDTDYEGAKTVAQRVVAGVLELDIPHAASEVSEIVTISVGVATTIPASGTDPFELAEAAESLTVQAKEAGRNQMKSALLDQKAE